MHVRSLAIALLALAFASSPGCKKKESSDAADESAGSSKSKKSKKGDNDEAEEEDEGSSKKGAKCPTAFHDFPDHDSKDEQACVCPKDSNVGAVYGTDLYTEDSSPCAAAVHAGVIESKGGKIKMKHAKGCPAYTGSKKNGVKSEGWGPFDGSFYFPDKSDSAPKCPMGECPHSFGEIKDVGPKTEIECKCGTYAEGTVYGTDMYTQDSSICAAAKHVGLIDDEGGVVKAKAAPGCGKYEAKKQNGVSSHEWHEYKASFYFPKKGDGVCKVPK